MRFFMLVLAVIAFVVVVLFVSPVGLVVADALGLVDVEGTVSLGPFKLGDI